MKEQFSISNYMKMFDSSIKILIFIMVRQIWNLSMLYSSVQKLLYCISLAVYLTVGGFYFLTACHWTSLTHSRKHSTTQSPLYGSVPVLSASGGIWVMRNKQGLCVCYFLFVPQWTHSAGTREGEQGRRSGTGWGPRRERGPLPGAEAPDPCASARGLPSSDTQIPKPAPQDLVQVPEKEWMPGRHQRGLRGRLKEALLFVLGGWAQFTLVGLHWGGLYVWMQELLKCAKTGPEYPDVGWFSFPYQVFLTCLHF